MLKKIPITSLVLVFLAYTVGTVLLFPLEPSKKPSHFIHDSWGIEDGLPQITVETVIQTSNGYLWLGTQEGLVRFDGVNFRIYSKRDVPKMTNNRVTSLLEDQKGNLWVGTYGGGLLCKDGGSGTFTDFSTSDGLLSNRIRTLYRDPDGTLWIGTVNGLNRLKNGKIFSFPIGETGATVRAVCRDNEGALWVGTYGNGLKRILGNNISHFDKKKGL
ncbi:MAG: hypothetical protein GY765_11055, partial [bacterium]|nr:hypothetical protein [bacterium]